MFRQHIARYSFASSFTRNKVILDLGCGEGFGASLLSKVAKKVIALDINREALSNARCELDNGAVQADACFAPFRMESFDMVVSFEVFEHILEVQSYLHEVYTILKKEGLFLMSTPNVDYYPMAGLNPYHVKEYTILEVTKLIYEAGFRNQRIFAQIPQQEQIARLERSRLLLFLMKVKRKIGYHGDLLPISLQKVVNRFIAGGRIKQAAIDDYKFIEGKEDEPILLYLVKK